MRIVKNINLSEYVHIPLPADDRRRIDVIHRVHINDFLDSRCAWSYNDRGEPNGIYVKYEDRLIYKMMTGG